jgi:hypothetical protein
VLNGSYDEKCDVYSYGITLLEVFAMRHAYEGQAHFARRECIIFAVCRLRRGQLVTRIHGRSQLRLRVYL